MIETYAQLFWTSKILIYFTTMKTKLDKNDKVCSISITANQGNQRGMTVEQSDIELDRVYLCQDLYV
jgi:hypothetical protein